VFTRSGGLWSQEAKLVGTGLVGFIAAEQGSSVALSADGNTAIIGGPGDNTWGGAAWVFTRSGGIWSQQKKLVGTGAIGPEGTLQGAAVSLSADGNIAIVGGVGDNDFVGATWVFVRSGGVWVQRAKLVGTDAIGSSVQGDSVSLSADGNTAIVGGPSDNGGSLGASGAAWVFKRSDGVWSQQQPKLIGTGAIGPNLPAQGVVSLSGDGRTAISGGPQDDDKLGAAWVFIEPTFAGTPGKSNCHGKSVSALARQYGGLNNAAAALDFPSVSALQDAIMMYCGG
jgi:hypothetical protein